MDKHILQRVPRLTKLEKSAQKVASFTAKVQNFKPDNAVLCRVLSADSPDELWVQDVVDSDQIYEKFHSNLNHHYTSLTSEESFTRTPLTFNVGDLCVMKKANRNEFHRVQVTEKSDNKYKLICVDIGQYEIADELNLFELEKGYVQPGFMAKKCFISGIMPTGTSDGQWSSLANEFTSTSLKDQYVYVVFLAKNDHTHEVCIYVSAGRKLAVNREPGDEKYVKFSDVLNTEGLALISGKNKTIDKLITESNLLSKCGKVCTGCYGYPDLPKKIYKNFQNNFQVFYDCLVTEVGYTNNRYYVWAMFPTMVNSLESFRQMSHTFDIFYSKNSPNFSLDYLMGALKGPRCEACVCRVGSNLYRGEILSHVAGDGANDGNFMVRLIDTGRCEIISAKEIFKPLEKFIEVDRLVYQITLDTDEITLSNQILSDLKLYLRNKMVKLKITRIINKDDDESEELYLTGEILFPDGQYQMNQILNGEEKNTASDQALEIPKLKIPSILSHEKHVITITWIENLEKAWFQFVFNDDNCVDDLKEIRNYSDLFVLMQNEFLNLKSQNKLTNIGLEELKEKKFCCCLYEQDMQLYRGMIQEVDFFSQTARVMYIDFGNVDTVSFNHIYELDQCFKQVPMQAIEFKIINKEEVLDKKMVDTCVEAEFYLDNHIPELKIYQIE